MYIYLLVVIEILGSKEIMGVQDVWSVDWAKSFLLFAYCNFCLDVKGVFGWKCLWNALNGMIHICKSN